MLIQSVLLTGASGTGKSTLIRGALEHYGSGLVVCAPGSDEMDSYVGLLDKKEYCFKGFDDLTFQPALKEKEWNVATGHTDMVRWLRDRFVECKTALDEGKPLPYRVLGVDTLSAVGRLAYNGTLSKFGLSEPPAAIGSSGAPFYSYLRNVLESGVRLMRAIRGLGVHWVVASHPTEAEATAVQSTEQSKLSSKVMPDLPGGFKNYLPSFFTTVLTVDINQEGKHFVRWQGDPKRVTKSRLGSLGPDKIVLPDTAKEAWVKVSTAVEAAMERLVKGS